MRKRSERGAQAVEFALILPVLIGLISSIIDYSWYFTRHGEMSEATKGVVRSAVTLDSQSSEVSPCQYVQSNLATKLDNLDFASSGRTLQTEISSTDGEARLTVNLRQDFDPLFGLITTPQTSVVRLVFRLEDQNWEGC